MVSRRQRRLVRVLVTILVLVAPLVTTAGDWPTYLHDASRSAASLGETTLSTANAGQLVEHWAYKTGGMIAASPTVVGNTVYVGAWDGYEYALNATTGALEWKTFLGITGPYAACNPPSAGITSGAAVVNGVVYVGGGDHTGGTNTSFYALDAGSGAILWTVNTGDGSATGGHYDWASPLIVGNYAYVGIASFGDCPLVQGQLLKVDLTAHTVVATANLVSNGELGAGVWTSPTYDAATNTVYVTTGTKFATDQTMSQAVVALAGTDLTIESAWQIPEDQALSDADFGTTPILVTDSGGHRLVVAMNKNGYLYAFSQPASATTAIDLAAGPTWEEQLDPGGSNPSAGDGTVSSAAFANGTLYQASGNIVVNGVGYGGAVSAINPANGAIAWQHPTAYPIVPAIAYGNGFIVDGEGPTVEVLDAGTGTRLYSYTTGAPLYGPPVVANGQIVIGGTDHSVYAFGLPASTPPTPPADGNCPSGWTCQDVGSPAPAGSESVVSGAWTVLAGGGGLAGAADAFRLLTEPATGDAQVTARIPALPTGTSNALAGLIVRQSDDPAAPYYAAFMAASGTLVVQYRATPGAAPAIVTQQARSAPVYLEIQRVGDHFSAATSTDGSSYALVPGTTVTAAMPATVLAGLAAGAGLGANGAAATATFSQVVVGPRTNAPAAASGGTCPSGWTCGDIGNPSQVGTQSLSAGTWTVQGGGTYIANQSDQFHSVWQSLNGDGTMVARVASQSNTDPNAEAGIMFRQSTAADSPMYGLLVTPGNGVVALYRSNGSFNTLGLASPSGTAPVYLKVTRVGAVFTAYTSSDGSTWTALGTSQQIARFPSTLLVGLAVSAHNTGTLGSAQFSNVSITPTTPLFCPAGWTCADLGGPNTQGSDAASGSTWTVQGGGGDIWGASDQFHFDWQTLPAGDGSVSAKVVAQSNSNGWAKAGLMVRSANTAYAAFYAVLVTPSNGIVVQYRGYTGEGANAVQAASSTGTVPTYLKVARAGTTYSAYTASDGVTWTLLPGSSITLPAFAGPLLAGVAVTAHDPVALSAVTFSAAAVTGSQSSPQTVVLPVRAGWNLIALPLSTTTLDAWGVLSAIVSQTHGYAAIAGLAGGQWSQYMYDDVADGIGAGGSDFGLQLGQGYALYSDKPGSVIVSGEAASNPPLSLAAGWNLVGFPSNPSTSYDILASVLGQTNGSYAEIDGYTRGQWGPSAFDGAGLGGANFSVTSGQGYALFSDKATP